MMYDFKMLLVFNQDSLELLIHHMHISLLTYVDSVISLRISSEVNQTKTPFGDGFNHKLIMHCKKKVFF